MRLTVLIGGEFSGVVRNAFIAAGHDAMSCDLLDTEQPGPHYKGDVRDLFEQDRFDLFIAHPDCTHLAVSGARHFAAKRADGRQQGAIKFFMEMVNAPFKKIAIEQPVSIMSTVYRKADQTIHPHQFGHPEFKATCFWLKRLPLLKPTCPLVVPVKGTPEFRKWERIHRMGPSPDRARDRSRTFIGIGAAMALQWGVA